jgi:hypothetical protein
VIGEEVNTAIKAILLYNALFTKLCNQCVKKRKKINF